MEARTRPSQLIPFFKILVSEQSDGIFRNRQEMEACVKSILAKMNCSGHQVHSMLVVLKRKYLQKQGANRNLFVT